MADQPMKQISELSEVIPGYSPKPFERLEEGEFLIVGGRNIRDGRLVRTDKDRFAAAVDRPSFRRAVLRPGDIVVAVLFDRRKVYVCQASDPKAIINNSCAIIRSNESDYIASYLETVEGQRLFLDRAQQATGGAFIPRLSIRDLGAIQVPIIPLEGLERLGDRHIHASTMDELLAVMGELKEKESIILKLQKENIELKQFFENRLGQIESQLSVHDLAQRIGSGETAKLEFKSTLRWDINRREVSRAIENAALKTIVAFCNTEGGELLIGVSDDGDVLGIDLDGFITSDKFLVHLSNLICGRIVPSVAGLVDCEMVKLERKTVCKVTCKESNTDVWLKPDKNTEEFYVRTGPTSKPLSPREASEYIRRRFR